MVSHRTIRRSFVFWLWCAVALISAPAAHAQDPSDYFPLHVGDSWRYVNPETGEAVVVKATSSGTVSTVLDNYWFDGAPRRFVDSADRIFELASGKSFLTYRLNLRTGASFRMEVAEPQTCLDGAIATVESRDAVVSVPAGTFERVLELSETQSQCADAGVSAEAFAPKVGLIRRVFVTFAGSKVFELAEANVGGVHYPQKLKGLSASATIDKFSYVQNRQPGPIGSRPPAPQLQAQLVVRNDTTDTVELNFPSTQRYDLVISDAEGKPVFIWSANKRFAGTPGKIVLDPGEETVFRQKVDLGPLPNGEFSLEFFLTSDRAFGGTVSFDKIEAF